MKWYLVNGVQYERSELEAMAKEMCYMVGPENVRNCLPQYSVEVNCKHHPIRIIREMGNTVEVVKI